ncbi:MAG: S9 family peptidase [Deltaproteobacteria bacterium]|nr:S9 family peptidase [Chloroflexota bacterium]MBM4385518.1 S9 family peptidase [Deltaproteobacteria bacterium]
MQTLLLSLSLACGGSQPAPVPRGGAEVVEPNAPVAEARPFDVTSPHGVRVDPYYWLRDDTRSKEDVLSYLRSENLYAEAMLRPSVIEPLYEEIVARIQQDDSTVPVFDRGYWYYVRYETGREYPIYARRKRTLEAPEEVLLDANALAEGHGFYQVGAIQVSPNGRTLAYTEDTTGRRLYVLRLKDLQTGQLLPDTATDLAGNVEWADDRTFFYVTKEAVTLRTYRVYRHRLGATGADTLVYEEPDTAYYTSIYTTKSRKYVGIFLWSTLASEVRLIEAARPEGAPKVFAAREKDHEYSVDHLDGRFVIRSNWQATNFRLLEVPEASSAKRTAWKDLVPHRDDAFVEGFGLYNTFVAVDERSGGLRKVRLLPKKGEPSLVAAEEPTYTMSLIDLPDPDSTKVRYVYTSLSTPDTTYELDLVSGERKQLKREPVLGPFDPAAYASEYLQAPAGDGATVPVSLVYRKDRRQPGGNPLLIEGYGSYGYANDPEFDSTLLSLLDRGVAVAVAHVRGGQELGRRWYENGKLLSKKNTFTDFVDVTEFLLAQGIAAPGKVFARGGSAGGLLMGAVINQRPELYRGVIAHVPFVDVVTTMLDESIPLTTNEFDEWGNPKDKAFYDYMASYSPYDNIRAQAYPAMLVTAGLHDSQVQYYEPAKWVAKLRAHKTDRNPLLFVVNMEAGHGGKSGRYQRYREHARDCAFVLQMLEGRDAR